LFKSRLMRAIEYQAAPFEVAIVRGKAGKSGRRVYGGSDSLSGRVVTNWPPRTLDNRAIYLSCGNSAKTGLAEASVDLVVTDPPFFDNVHYSELADFFFAWQQLGPTPFAKVRHSTRHVEEVQDVSAEQFATKLRRVFEECRRVLRQDGLLVFSYHHSRADGWLSLAEAVADAGFSIVNCQPVKAEMSGATPKSQAKEPIQLDVILVCRKQSADVRPKLSEKDALSAATERARAKAARLQSVDMDLSANDRRVVLIGQFLAEACSGRSPAEFVATLAASLTDLDLAALSLCQETVKPAGYAEALDAVEPQLVLLERPMKQV
jgi:putative DNA methylase